MNQESRANARSSIAVVGGYADTERDGGLYTFRLDGSGRLSPLTHVATPEQAGYLAYGTVTRTLYTVDERKTDGRGPVQSQAAVHSLSVGEDGELTPLSVQSAVGPFPTYLAVDEGRSLLVCVSHGSFDHVERVVADPPHGWRTEFVYDDSTVVVYELEADGRVGVPSDVQVLAGHGSDPNGSPQADGHGQASPHAHCGVFDRTGRFLLVADKGTDRIYVYEFGRALRHVFTYQAQPQSGPRHLAFHPTRDQVFATYEFSSEVASFDFDGKSGELSGIDRVASVFTDLGRVNEPADIRIHPSGQVLYVNNRGEDSLAWFAIRDDGTLDRRGHVLLAHSVHPGVAARSFAIDPAGEYLLVADRPADLVRTFAINAEDYSLEPLADIAVPNPASVLIVTFDTTAGE